MCLALLLKCFKKQLRKPIVKIHNAHWIISIGNVSAEPNKYLNVNKARICKEFRSWVRMACSIYFHNMGPLLLQQRLDISKCPRSTLGTCKPASRRHLVTSTPHKRAGSPRSCNSCVSSNTFCCHCWRDEESTAICSFFVPVFSIRHTDRQSELTIFRRMRSWTSQNVRLVPIKPKCPNSSDGFLRLPRKPKGLNGSDGFLGLSQHLRCW